MAEGSGSVGMRKEAMSRQLHRIVLDDDTTSSGSFDFPPRHEGVKATAPKRITRAQASPGAAPESSASSEEDRKARGVKSPGRALREAQMDEVMRLRGGRGRQGEEQAGDTDMTCDHESSADAAHSTKRSNPSSLLLRASTESEVATLRKMAVQAAQVVHQKTAKRSANSSGSSAGPKRKAGRLAERRLKAKIHSKREKGKAAARDGHSSNLTPPLASVEDRQYDSDDMMLHSGASASEGPSTMLTAAALIAAASVKGVLRNSADHEYSPPGSPTYTTPYYLRHQLRRLGSTSSSFDTRMRCSEVYELHLGVLPSPIECLRNEYRSPSELRFYRLPTIMAGHPAVQGKHHATQPEPVQSGSQSNEKSPEDSLDYISMRELEKDWDEWRWESISSGGEPVFLGHQPLSIPAPQEIAQRA